jgi:hypothetical protein
MRATEPHGLIWRKAKASQGSQGCVEAATLDRWHLVRDSKDPDGPVLAFTGSEWAAFIARAKDDAFDMR